MKEEFFSKFRDYNKELEKILENKGFSKEVKNLLLSMFYKLEISYNDYFLVKRNSRTKQEIITAIQEFYPSKEQESEDIDNISVDNDTISTDNDLNM